ncbi:hypothetical protein J6590_007097, partial [Homalodisca vitripennis]
LAGGPRHGLDMLHCTARNDTTASDNCITHTRPVRARKLVFQQLSFDMCYSYGR